MTSFEAEEAARCLIPSGSSADLLAYQTRRPVEGDEGRFEWWTSVFRSEGTIFVSTVSVDGSEWLEWITSAVPLPVCTPGAVDVFDSTAVFPTAIAALSAVDPFLRVSNGSMNYAKPCLQWDVVPTPNVNFTGDDNFGYHYSYVTLDEHGEVADICVEAACLEDQVENCCE